jgi:ABC-type sugar transport system substrate-binding protein
MTKLALGTVAVFSALMVGGCGPSSPAPSAPPVVEESPHLKAKLGVIVSDPGDEWIAKEVEVIKASPFFTGGVVVLEAKDTSKGVAAITELKSQGCGFVVLLGPEGAYDGQQLADAADQAKLNLAVLHWRLFGSGDKPVDVPFVGIHENQVADSLAQTALKSPLSAKAKVLYVGSETRHAEFFERADATLSTKIDTKKAIRCDVPSGKTSDEYRALVAARLKGQSMTQPWIVLGLSDSYALGGAKALSAAGAKDILAFGVGTTLEAQKAWESNADYALNASILLNPYPEVKTLARVLSKWEQSGGKSKAILVGGTVTQKETYASLIKGMISPAAGDK